MVKVFITKLSLITPKYPQYCWVLSAGHKADTRRESRISVLMMILISLLVAGNVLHNFGFIGGGTIQQGLSSTGGVALFLSLVAATYIVGQYILLGFVKRVARDIRDTGSLSSYFFSMYRAMRIIQYITAGILALMGVQMLLTSHYHVGLLVAAMSINFALLCVLAAVMSYRLFSWFKLNRNIIVFFVRSDFCTVCVVRYTNISNVQ